MELPQAAQLDEASAIQRVRERLPVLERAERAMNKFLNGGCQVPIAGFATYDQGVLSMEGRVGSVDGQVMYCGGVRSIAV